MELEPTISNAQAKSVASRDAPPAAAPVDKTPASLARRLAAMTYDWVLLAGPIAIYALVVVVLRAGEAVEPNTLWFSAGLAGIPAAFFCGFWINGGRTLGMIAWRIEIVTVTGAPLRWPRALGRCCAALLSLLPAGLGFLWSIWDSERATWHDRLSGTRLVRSP